MQTLRFSVSFSPHPQASAPKNSSISVALTTLMVFGHELVTERQEHQRGNTGRARQRWRWWHMQSAPRTEELFAGCLTCPSLGAKCPLSCPASYFPHQRTEALRITGLCVLTVRGESDEIKCSCHTRWRKFKFVIVLGCVVLALPFHLGS